MENNIYIENHEEISKYMINDRIAPVDVQLDMFEAEYGYVKDRLARAEYIEKFCPVNLSLDEKKLLEEYRGEAE